MSLEQALADARVRATFEAMDSGEGDGVGVERARKNAAGTSD